MRARYAPPEWGLAWGVGNGTGARCRGWADAIAMNLWPSRGLAVHGFELKATRGDWLRELREPAKAENVARYCDYWWLVVGERKVVAPGELPDGWGLLELRGRGLMAAREPQKLPAVPLDRGFIAALMRRVSLADDSVIRELVQKELKELRETDRTQISHEREKIQRELGLLRTKLAEVRDGTGIDLLTWQPAHEFVQALQLVLRFGPRSVHQNIRTIVRSAERFVTEARAVLDDKRGGDG